MGTKKNWQNQIVKQKVREKIFTALFLICASNAKAQISSEAPAERKWMIEFGGAIGPFVPFQQGKNEKTLIGTSSLTAIQFNYKKQFFGRLQFAETRIGFKNQTDYGTVSSDIDVNASNLNLGIFVGYHYGIGNWQPLVLLGVGPSLIGIPVTSYDPNTNIISYRTKTDTYLHATGGVGVNYNLSKSIILLLEFQGTILPGIPKKPATHLDGVNALINIKISI